MFLRFLLNILFKLDYTANCSTKKAFKNKIINIYIHAVNNILWFIISDQRLKLLVEIVYNHIGLT